MCLAGIMKYAEKTWMLGSACTWKFKDKKPNASGVVHIGAKDGYLRKGIKLFKVLNVFFYFLCK